MKRKDTRPYATRSPEHKARKAERLISVADNELRELTKKAGKSDEVTRARVKAAMREAMAPSQSR